MEKQPVAWKEYCVQYWLKELQESMNRYTGPHDITEILLKTALKTVQSAINQPITTLFRLLMTLGEKPFKNIVGKGDAGNQHFLLFSQCFLPY